MESQKQDILVYVVMEIHIKYCKYDQMWILISGQVHEGTTSHMDGKSSKGSIRFIMQNTLADLN